MRNYAIPEKYHKFSGIFCIICLLVYVRRSSYNVEQKEVCDLGGKTSAASKNKWIAKAYDRINLTVPKGRKAAIEAHANKTGDSVNGLINRLLRADMGLTEDEWKEGQKEDNA